MIQTRARKIIADVLSRKGRTLLVAFSIMMGVFGVVVLVSMGDLLVSQIEKDTPPETIATGRHIVVLPTGRYSREENRAILDEIEENVPGVVRAEGQIVFPVSWRLPDAPANSRFSTGILHAFSEPFNQVQIDGIRKVFEGRYPEPGKNEIAVEIRFAELNGVGVGDTLMLQALNPEDPPTEWTITGTVLYPQFILSSTIADNILQEQLIYANYEDAQRIVGVGGVNRIFTRSTNYQTGLATVDELAAYIAEETPYVSVLFVPENPDNSLLFNQVNEIVGLLGSLAFVSMFVSGFLVINVINTIIVEQRQQIGVMKSLGASRWDILFIYAGISFVYGLIGTTLSLAIGIPVASAITRDFAREAFTYIDGFNVSVQGVIAGAVLGILVPVVVSIIPVLLGTRVTILEAVTDLGISSKWGTGIVGQTVKDLPLPITVRQALANVIQKAGRISLTGFTLMLAVAAFMGVTAMLISMEEEVATFYSPQYEVFIKLQDVQDFEGARETILTIDGVEDGYPGFDKMVGVQGYTAPDNDVINRGTNNVLAAGVDPDNDVIGWDFLEGRAWEDGEDGIIISRSLAKELNRGPEEEIVIELDGNTEAFEIIGVHNFAFASIWFRWDTLAALSGFTDAAGNSVPNAYYVNLTGEPSIDETADILFEIDKVLRGQGIVATLNNQPESAQEQADQLAVFAVMLNITSFVMAGVGGIGLLATLSMAVFERQKEIGVMRSIGAGSGTIIMQFLSEGMLVGVLSWIVAIPLGYVLGDLLLASLPFPDLRYLFPPVLLLVGLVGIILVTMLASIWPSMMAARKTVSDILRYQ